MTERDLELARQIAVNSGDIREMMEQLIYDNETLSAESGAKYHENAMRTAAGPEVFYRAMINDLVFHPNDRRRYSGQEAIRAAVADFIHSARVLSAMKATLFYGKEYKAPDPRDADKLVGDDFHTDHFESYQLLHAIFGVGSEAGELFEDVVQLVSLPDPSDCDEEDLPKHADAKNNIVANMRRELGDIDWFQELLAESFNSEIGVTGSRRFTIDDCRAENIARLRDRFPGKFTEEDAIARKDDCRHDHRHRVCVVEDKTMTGIPFNQGNAPMPDGCICSPMDYAAMGHMTDCPRHRFSVSRSAPARVMMFRVVTPKRRCGRARAPWRPQLVRRRPC